MSNRRFEQDPDDYDDARREEEARWRREGRQRDVSASAQEAIRRASSKGKKPTRQASGLLSRTPVLVGVLIAGVFVLAIILYLILGQRSEPVSQTPQQPAQTTRQTPPATDTPAQPPAAPKEDDGIISRIFGSEATASTTSPPESLLQRIARMTLRLALAALLAAMLAFRPRKDLPSAQRNPYVAQTQILLAVVAAALMMIVADNAARAFGIFAAASLVRFRTTVRDPKEITVLLISLGIGLAAGVGRVELAVVLALFVLLMLWVLEYYEPAQVFRSMELTITTRNVDMTDEILKEVFEKNEITSELRVVNREDKENPIGKIVYYINVSPTISTDSLSEEIFGADPQNIDSIEWDQKKSTSYTYR